jgi:hypothetical protein
MKSRVYRADAIVSRLPHAIRPSPSCWRDVRLLFRSTSVGVERALPVGAKAQCYALEVSRDTRRPTHAGSANRHSAAMIRKAAPPMRA